MSNAKGPERVRRRVADGATISAVAAHARVSRQTVSNVLNAPERVTSDTAARVREAIDALGYRPNRVARQLRRRSTGLIGYRIDHGATSVNSVLTRFLHALADAGREAGYHLLLFTPTDPDDELATYDELIRTATVDGFVVAETYIGDERPAWLTGRGVPVTCFGRPWGHEADGYAWVDVDGAHGTDAATEHLIQAGHERIAFLGWPVGSGVGDDRAAGWARAMASHRLPTSGLRLACEDSGGAAAAAGLLASVAAPTAFVCASDMLALGARNAAGSAAISVIGFDDSPVTELVSPQLSSVRQPIEEAGRTVVRMLLDQLSGTAAQGRGVLLTPELVLRGD